MWLNSAFLHDTHWSLLVIHNNILCEVCLCFSVHRNQALQETSRTCMVWKCWLIFASIYLSITFSLRLNRFQVQLAYCEMSQEPYYTIFCEEPQRTETFTHMILGKLVTHRNFWAWITEEDSSCYCPPLQLKVLLSPFIYLAIVLTSFTIYLSLNIEKTFLDVWLKQ